MIIIMASLGITSGRNDFPGPSDETNTIASISVPDLNHDLHPGTIRVIDPGMSTNSRHYVHHHYHHRRPHPLALEMSDRSKTVTHLTHLGMNMNMHHDMGSMSRLPEDSEDCLASPTSPASPSSVKTVVGRDSYTGTGSWTSYTGHLKGRGSGLGGDGDHESSVESGSMMSESYVYARGGTVTGDSEAQKKARAPGANARMVRSRGLVTGEESEKGRAL